MIGRFRAKLAVRLLAVARELLQVKPSDGDFDTCVYCKTPGCESEDATHARDCPAVTGVFPVTLRDLWPYGPAICDRCSSGLWPGDSYSYITLEDGPVPIVEVACTGCALLAEVEAA